MLATSFFAALVATESPRIDQGMAVGDLWEASAAEYQASVEGQLERVGGRNVQASDPIGSIMADFLQMFAGGGGAPQDLVRPRPEGLGSR